MKREEVIKGNNIKEYYMRIALSLAEKAQRKDEVPIGAIIVLDGKIIAKAINLVERTNLATMHAEMIAIKKASKKLKNKRLLGAEMYVTLEPCPMCAGAIANARMSKVYFGAYEQKSGCAVSKYPVLSDNGLNHSVEYEGGVLEEECSKIIKDYFKKKRAEKTLT